MAWQGRWLEYSYGPLSAPVPAAAAVSSGWPNPHVTGCHVSMAKLDVIVYQVSGWSQATKYESEKWAAPYTW